MPTDRAKRRPTVEELHRRDCLRDPLMNVLMKDTNSPGSNIYDAAPNEWFTAHRDDALATDDYERDTVWCMRGPLSPRKALALTLPSRSAVVTALVHLAKQTHRAFRVSTADLELMRGRYGHVLMPRGDRRAAGLAANGNAHEVDGVPSDVALLFSGAEPNDNGLFVEYPVNRTTSLFGVAIWGSFYAIQFETLLFERDATLPIRSDA